MRLRREQWPTIGQDDVEWVTEWQLATAFRWLPLQGERTVKAAPSPEPGDGTWRVDIRAGEARVRVFLPVRDLARLIFWCYSVGSTGALLRPPVPIRGSMLALRAALRSALRRLDPLGRMGYVEREPGTAGA